MVPLKTGRKLNPEGLAEGKLAATLSDTQLIFYPKRTLTLT
jgi:hypothetical protein